MALPPKIFFHFSLNYAILSEKVFGGNAIGNVAKQKSAALPRADDSGQYLLVLYPGARYGCFLFKILQKTG